MQHSQVLPLTKTPGSTESEQLLSAQRFKEQSLFNFDFEILDKTSAKRDTVEQLIQRGFSAKYKAVVAVTMPYLVALTQDADLGAALGFRSAQETLFLEQYLDVPIEQVSYFAQQHVPRKSIAEIGHLYSNCPHLTLHLFILLALSLENADFTHIVFAGNNRVMQIMQKSGVQMEYLASATQDKLKTSRDYWGNYYETNPRVVAVSLKKTQKLILRHPLFQRNADAIEALVNRSQFEF